MALEFGSGVGPDLSENGGMQLGKNGTLFVFFGTWN